MITLTLTLMLNIFQTFPPAAITNCQIAQYDMINLRNNRLYDFTLIKTDDLIIEITKIKTDSTELHLTESTVENVEFRNVYDIGKETVTTYQIMHDKSALAMWQRPFSEYSIEGYRIEEKIIDGNNIVSIYADTTLRYALTLSKEPLNFHHTSIFFPEIHFLPDVIEAHQMRHTLNRVIVDDAEKFNILDACKLDIESFKRIIGEQDLRNFAKVAFGTSLEDALEEIKRMAGKEKP